MPGSDPQQKESYILIGRITTTWATGLPPARGAAWPHLPRADDNASGTSGVMALAQALALLAEPPHRSILLVCWDGEEKGLLGSKYWTGHPTVPPAHFSAMINLDMIGSAKAG